MKITHSDQTIDLFATEIPEICPISLSGGLDSSLLVAIAKSQMTNQKLNCFTIDQFKNSKENFFEDDLPYAKKIFVSYSDLEGISKKYKHKVSFK
mgnify:CR=1 FL=1